MKPSSPTTKRNAVVIGFMLLVGLSALVGLFYPVTEEDPDVVLVQAVEEYLAAHEDEKNYVTRKVALLQSYRFFHHLSDKHPEHNKNVVRAHEDAVKNILRSRKEWLGF